MGLEKDAVEALGKLDSWQAEHQFYSYKVAKLKEDFKKIDALVKSFIQDNIIMDSQQE